MTVQHIVMLEFNDGVDEETLKNSLKAVEALKDKIDGIEKIESGKDFSGRAGDFSHAVIVTMHDKDVLRTTNFKEVFTDGRSAKVTGLSLEQLRRLDAGSWFSPEFEGESIPTLEEVFFQIRGKISVNIEIKPESYESAGPADAIEKQICIMVEKFGMNESVLISSFEHSFFPRIKLWHGKDNNQTSLRIAPLQEKEFSEENVLKLCKGTEAYSFHPDERFLTPSLIKILKASSFRTIAYTINDEKRIEQLAKWGVTGIITDEPELAWKVLRKFNCNE